MVTKLLPEQFADLDALGEAWALPTELERNRKRLASDFDEIKHVYDTLLPRMEEIITYLNQFPLEDMPAEAERLMLLSLAFMEVSTAVEMFGQSAVPYGFPSERYEFYQ